MSEENEPVETCCASCGIAEIDDIKLMECDGCDLVKYCSDACRELHQPEHAGKCRKRAAELRDELLFKQPESTHMGDCPICAIPLPIDQERYITYECCSKVVCKGCVLANGFREKKAAKCLSCPFCRNTAFIPKSKKDLHKMLMKRVKANDPAALCEEAIQQYKKGHYSRAFGYLSKSADLGHAEAHWRLADMYDKGKGVEKDEGKYIRHLEEASILGHPNARVLLGINEYGNNNLDRAVKHWIISATQGYDYAIKMLMDGFKEGYVEKEELAAALRAQKAAVDATKSPQRQLEENLLSK